MRASLIRSPRSPFRPSYASGLLVVIALLAVTACDSPPPDDGEAEAAAAVDSARFVAEVTGFMGPESVRYDSDHDVYFVGNFNGGGMDADNNGFISRVSPDGTVDSLRFIQGGREDVTLHAPRGMAITGDTLWACDVDAVRGFDRQTGAPLATVDFSDMDTGFLNDVTPGPDGALYVTDTGRDAVYRIAGGNISTLHQDSLLNSPNGITWDAERNRFIVVPYGGAQHYFVWTAQDTTLTTEGSVSGAQLDGVEVVEGGALIISSQADSSLHAVSNGSDRVIAELDGRPADIGYDSRRGRIAVPYIARNLVEIWELP